MRLSDALAVVIIAVGPGVLAPAPGAAQRTADALAQLGAEAGAGSSTAGAALRPAAAAVPSGRSVGGTGASLLINIFDGTRRPLPPDTQVLVRIFDGNQKEIVSHYYKGSSLRFEGLPIHDNSADNYRVIVWAGGYKQAGFFPRKLTASALQTADLMLVPAHGRFDFSGATWAAIKEKRPQLWRMLMLDAADERSAQTRYESLALSKPESLACLLNITAALSQIQMPSGRDALSYFDELVWDESLKKDRFFVYADYELLIETRRAARQGLFGKESHSNVFHPGAFTSFKQLEFEEGDVQFTFHHDDVHVPHDHQEIEEKHIKVEPDIDLYRDLGAHLFLEVVPGLVPGNLTDPKDVYQLRWMAGRQAGAPDFDPLYTITR